MKFLRRFLIICLTVLLLSVPVLAADGSITVHCLQEETPLAGVPFQIYRADGQTDTHAAYAAVVQAGQAPLAESVTNALGNAVFPGLADGTYLLVGQPYAVNGQIFEFDMSLVTLPGVGIDGAPVPNVTVQPKFTIRDAAQSVEYRVVVIWEGESSHPETVPVRLYRNGLLHETITANAADGWLYAWEDSDPTALWVVVEEAPEGYTVSYERDGNTFMICNTPIPSGDPGQPGPSDPSLPQTGQLWWPVPLLAILGMILLLLGWFRKKELRNEG